MIIKDNVSSLVNSHLLIRRSKKKLRGINNTLPPESNIHQSATLSGVDADTGFIVKENATIKNTFFGVNVRVNPDVVIKSSKIGSHVLFDKNSHVLNSELHGVNRIYKEAVLNDVKLGSYSYIGARCRANFTTIGKFCSVGQEVKMCLGLHPSDTYVSSHPSFYSTKNQVPDTFADKDYFEEFSELSIGNDVWIGISAIIMGGITIGDGAIIAAGSVVTKDVPPYAIVGGIPAKVIKYRFSEDQINHLLEIKWWNRDYSWIRENFRKFHNINTFLSEYKEDL